MKVTACLMSTCVVLVVCCAPSEDELRGSYLCKYSFGSESLSLDSGGTFTQRISLDHSSTPIVNQGTWNYERELKTIVFVGRIEVVTPDGSLAKDLHPIPNSGVPVYKILGGIVLEQTPDSPSNCHRVNPTSEPDQ